MFISEKFTRKSKKKVEYFIVFLSLCKMHLIQFIPFFEEDCSLVYLKTETFISHTLSSFKIRLKLLFSIIFFNSVIFLVWNNNLLYLLFWLFG